MSARLAELTKFLSTVRGDLANITAPPFFLAPSSVVENPQSWAQRPAVFTAAAVEPKPEKRSLLVLQMFLIGLRNQLYVAGAPNVSIKKPLNAFLGELFLASWTDPKSSSTTRLVVEQVSHHPPITAMHIASGEHGIRADGYGRVKMTYFGNINIQQIGHGIIHIDRYDEDYLVPLPNVIVRGFLSACLYPEIIGTYTINSSSGYVSEINFSGTGIFRGKRNSFEARVYHSDNPKKSCYELSGVWSEEWRIIDGKTGELLETYDVNGVENTPAQIDIAPVEDQDPWESRRAWRDVVSALEEGNYRAASIAKHKVEEAQRKRRSDEKKRGVTWKPLFFRSIPGDEHEVFHRVAEGTSWQLLDAETKGVWRIDDKRLESLERPFRK
ncbi:oxysterol-binding protein [Ilyonectria sp. MPI-CAGE-AT-0026]|nr:oxysterol-binding protein [Ilyonectria sp. MPI-CAGE-AT-0026]